MKKRIFTLLMAMVMIFGLTQTSFAEDIDDRYNFYINCFFEIEGDEESGEGKTVLANYSNEKIMGEYITRNGDVIFWNASSPCVDEFGTYYHVQVMFNDLLVAEEDAYAFVQYNSFKLHARDQSDSGTFTFTVEGDLTDNNR